eukprot:m.181986 g.181986  ORF g.181986 m.181986 type:complete len:238 (+) comp9996_c5_seq51:611-1324(+)
MSVCEIDAQLNRIFLPDSSWHITVYLSSRGIFECCHLPTCSPRREALSIVRLYCKCPCCPALSQTRTVDKHGGRPWSVQLPPRAGDESMLGFTDIIVIFLGIVAFLLFLRIVIFTSCACCGSPRATTTVVPLESVQRELADRVLKSVNDTYPSQPYRPATQESTSGTPSCIICIEPFQANEPIRKFPCSHMFHETCITPWFEKQRAAICPLCKQNVLEMASCPAVPPDGDLVVEEMV